MAFCFGCMKETPYVKETAPKIFFVRGTKVEYNEFRAHCPTCKRELYIPELHDLNCINRTKAYSRMAKGE